MSAEDFKKAVEPLVIGYQDETAEDWTWVEPKYDEYDFDEAAKKGMGIKTDYGFITFVEDGTVLNEYGDKVEYTVYKLGDKYYRVDGWSDSWSGDGETYWDQAYEVVQRPVTRYEYLRVSEGDSPSG